MQRVLVCFFGLIVSSSVLAQETPELRWELCESSTSASLRGLWVVDEDVVWASGSGGTVLKTVDGGETWENVSIAGAKGNDFRDIHAFDDQSAVVITAGQPAIFYKTNDGGRNWNKVFQHPNEKSFFDAVAAISESHLIAMSDPIDDRILLVESLDKGETWQELPAERRPVKESGEAGFAASGSNMIVDSGNIYLALGSAEEGDEHETSRVVYSTDQARTWKAYHLRLARNQSSGIFSITKLPNGRLLAVGGDYQKPDATEGNCAIGLFDELNNCLIPKSRPSGYRSGVCFTRLAVDRELIVAVGPNGSDYSLDSGETWERFSDVGFHAVKSTGDGTIWASGSEGRIAKLNVK